MEFTQAEIDLVQSEFDDWLKVLAAYDRDFEAGRALAESKNARCGLCPRFRGETRGENGEYHFSCRRCPVVKVFNRSCVGLRMKASYPEDWAKRMDAPEVVRETIVHIRFMLQKMTGISAYEYGGGAVMDKAT